MPWPQTTPVVAGPTIARPVRRNAVKWRLSSATPPGVGITPGATGVAIFLEDVFHGAHPHVVHALFDVEGTGHRLEEHDLRGHHLMQSLGCNRTVCSNEFFECGLSDRNEFVAPAHARHACSGRGSTTLACSQASMSSGSILSPPRNPPT